MNRDAPARVPCDLRCRGAVPELVPVALDRGMGVPALIGDDLRGEGLLMPLREAVP
jgi:hypothetical protein